MRLLHHRLLLRLLAAATTAAACARRRRDRSRLLPRWLHVLLWHGREEEARRCAAALPCLHRRHQGRAESLQPMQQRLIQEHQHPAGRSTAAATAAAAVAAASRRCRREARQQLAAGQAGRCSTHVQLFLWEHEIGWQARQLSQRGAPVVHLRWCGRARRSAVRQS